MRVEIANLGQTKAGLWVLGSLHQAWLEAMPSDTLYTGPREVRVGQLNCSMDSGLQLEWPSYTPYGASYGGPSGYAELSVQYNLPPGSVMTCTSTSLTPQLQNLPPGEVRFSVGVWHNTIQGVDVVEVTLPVPRSPYLSLDMRVSRCVPSSETGALNACSLRSITVLCCFQRALSTLCTCISPALH